MEPDLASVPSTTPLHSVAFLVIADRWIKGIPDDDDACDLRAELQYFLRTTKFTWQAGESDRT